MVLLRSVGSDRARGGGCPPPLLAATSQYTGTRAALAATAHPGECASRAALPSADDVKCPLRDGMDKQVSRLGESTEARAECIADA
eukprot:1391230-Pleurochrysis_carterae.AAC.1